MLYFTVLLIVFIITKLSKREIEIRQKIMEIAQEIESEYISDCKLPENRVTHKIYRSNNQLSYIVIGSYASEQSAYIAELCLKEARFLRLSALSFDVAQKVKGCQSIYFHCRFWGSDFFEHTLVLNRLKTENQRRTIVSI